MEVVVALPKEHKQAGLPDAQICILALNKARTVGADYIRIQDPSGWHHVYTVSEVITYLRRFPEYQAMLNFHLPQPDEPELARYRGLKLRKTRGGLYAA